MRIRVARALAWAGLLGVLSLAFFWNTLPVAHAATASQYFPQTGHSVSGKFLDYWRSHGGLPVFGYPLTEAQNEIDPETGKTFLTQWFERNRFELHPENAGTPYEVLLGLLGKQLRHEAQAVDPDFVRHAPLGGDEWYFSETGQNLGGAFRDYWRANGSLERFGFPISTEHFEVEPETNKVYRVQWFERARFEYHSENAPPNIVLLGLLGKQIKSGTTSKIGLSWVVGENPAALYRAGGVAADADGNIYVTDDSRQAVKRYDTQGNFIGVYSYLRGYGDYELSGPNAVTTDRQGNVYLIDGGRIKKYTRAGREIAIWPIKGTDYFDDGKAITVDSAGNMYVATARGMRKYDPTGNLLLTWGGKGNIAGLFDGITAIALDSHGTLYVADTGNGRIQTFDSTGHFLKTWADGLVSAPKAIAIDLHDTVYVGDGSKIKTFDTVGNPKFSWAISATNSSTPYTIGLTTDAAGNLYVTAETVEGVVKFDSQGKQLLAWGSALPRFSFPQKIAIGKGNRFYILDSSRYSNETPQIAVLDTTGHSLGTLGSSGKGAGQYNQPTAIATDASGDVYVSDADPSRLLKYDASGTYLAALVLSDPPPTIDGLGVDAQGNIYIGDGKNHRIRKYDSGGHSLIAFGSAGNSDYFDNSGEFALPTGIAFGAGGAVYVADGGEPGCSCINKFDSTGNFILRWGTQDGGNGEFYSPAGVATDAAGNVYVADSKNHRFQKFDANGKFLGLWSSQGTSDGQVIYPQSIAVDAAGNIYVTDSNGRIEKFQQS